MNVSLRMGNRHLADDGESRFGISMRALLLLVGLFTAAGVLYAYTAIRILNVQYEISRELETQREQNEVGRRLKLELSNLRAPEHLEREGARLGLGGPKAEQLRGLR